MPGDHSRSYKGPADGSPVVPSWMQDDYPRICRRCEFFDGGGLDALGFPKEENGDCHNRLAPRFTTHAQDTCPWFLLSTTFVAP